ncbi:MAG: adenylate/guanylate cyclase domain-containing protein [Rhodospirillales bacterium]
MAGTLRKMLAPALSVAVIGALAAIVIADPAPLRAARNIVFDGQQRWTPRKAALDVPVRIVDIDNDSLAEIGQWPWPRTVLARLVEKLSDAGAAAIVFDIVFAEPDRTSPAEALRNWQAGPDAAEVLSRLPDHDTAFAEAIAGAPVVLGVAFGSGKDGARKPLVLSGIAFGGDDPRESLAEYDSVTANLDILEHAAAGIGNFNFISDGDGVVRRVPLFVTMDGEIYPSLVAEALRVARGAGSHVIKSTGANREIDAGGPPAIASVKIADVVIPTDASGAMRLYMAPSDPDRYIPARDVLNGSADPVRLAGHIVLIGTSAAGLFDLRYSPLGQPLPGVELHAQALEQVIGEYVIERQPELREAAGRQLIVRPDWAQGAETLAMLALSLCLIAAILAFGAMVSAIAGLAAIAAANAGAAWAFQSQGWLFDPVTPSVGILLTYLTLSILRHIQAERDRRWIETAFASYISPSIVKELVRHPDRLRLGGERREMTFLFTDLEGFTPLVEKNPPEKLIPLLNAYLNGLTKIGFAHEGTLDKIVGDATMFYWNAPVDQPDHAARAFACALEIDSFAETFRRQASTDGFPLGITRIGLHSGSVIVGNMGGDAIFDYSAHGDAVNTAARLESVNKQLRTRICVSATTAAQVADFIGRPVGDLVLKGRTETESCLEPLAAGDDASAMIDAYNRAYRAMAQHDPSAAEMFAALVRQWPDDGPSRFHLDRLRHGETGVRVVLGSK